jgi:hypothetical protein
MARGEPLHNCYNGGYLLNGTDQVPASVLLTKRLALVAFEVFFTQVPAKRADDVGQFLEVTDTYSSPPEEPFCFSLW